jgi:hypothetical protein
MALLNQVRRQTRPTARKKARTAGRVCLVLLQFAPPQLAISSGGRNVRLAGTRYALPGTGGEIFTLWQAVRQRQTHVLHVGRIDLNFVEKPAHAARLLGAQQMALSRPPAHYFAGGRDFEALGGAAVRLGFHFLILLHDFLFGLSGTANSGGAFLRHLTFRALLRRS